MTSLYKRFQEHNNKRSHGLSIIFGQYHWPCSTVIGYCLLCLLCVSILVGCFNQQTKRSDIELHNLSERYVEMGVNYMGFGQLNVAMEKLEHALEIDDDNANAHNSIAVFYEHIKDNKQAEYHFEEALSLAPKDVSILNNYGRFLCNNGSQEQGIAYLTKAAESALNESPWFALTNLGLCLFMQGNSNDSERYFRQALQYNPEYPPPLLSMAELNYEKAQYMKTRAFLERFLSYHNATSKVLILGFLAEQALGQKRQAEVYKSQLLLKFPLSDEAIKIKQMQALMAKPKNIRSRLIPLTLKQRSATEADTRQQ